MPTNIVIPLDVPSAWQDNELRYHLRSLQDNIGEFNLTILTGSEPPSWLKGATVINVPRYYPERLAHKNSKEYECYFDTCNKLFVYCWRSDCPEEFVWAYDDQILFKPTDFEEFKGLGFCVEKGRYRKRLTRHEETIKQALNLSGGKINCEHHGYKPYNRDKLRNMFGLRDFRGMDIPYSVNTLYRNMFNEINRFVVKEITKDVAYIHKGDGHHHYFIIHPQEVTPISQEYTMLSYDDFGLNVNNGALKRWIEARYSHPSIFER